MPHGYRTNHHCPRAVRAECCRPHPHEAPVPDRVIAIIGAGFSGTLTAVHLLRGGTPGRLRVVLVNRSAAMARGVAYGTSSERHLLNVPAGRMSAFAHDPDGFLRFARERDPSVSGGSFVPRRLFGDYLEALLAEARRAPAPGASLEHVRDEVVDVDPGGSSSRARVMLRGGRTIEADRVVIALGNFAPANPVIPDPAFFASPRYVRDPWGAAALDAIGAEEPVLLIGTGLTMVDVALDLASRAPRSAPIHAVSRRGLLPLPHREHGAQPAYGTLPAGLTAGEPSALGYLRAVRAQVRAAAAAGVDWRDVVAALRPLTPALWMALDARERARFLRHLRPYWDVHRHRLAPASAAALGGMLASGALRPMAARIEAMEDHGHAARVVLRPRGSTAREAMRVAHVVNCTGPESSPYVAGEALLAALRARGAARPDAAGLGFDVGERFALVDAAGRPSGRLFLVGPLLRAQYWEATAVPELREHVESLGRWLLADAAPAVHPAPRAVPP